jgi:hypothetical protein
MADVALIRTVPRPRRDPRLDRRGRQSRSRHRSQRGRRRQHLRLHRLADGGPPAVPDRGEIPLPQPAPHLANHVVIVTGSGRRLREIQDDPVANLGAVRISPDGTSGTLHTRRAGSSTGSPRSGTRTSRFTTTRLSGPARTSTLSSTPSRRTSPTSATSPSIGTRTISTGACCGGSRRRSSTFRPESALCRSCCPAPLRSWRPT